MERKESTKSCQSMWCGSLSQERSGIGGVREEGACGKDYAKVQVRMSGTTEVVGLTCLSTAVVCARFSASCSSPRMSTLFSKWSMD